MKILILLFLIVNVFAQDKGSDAYKNKRYDAARLFYENILKSRDDDESAKYGLGVSAYKQNDIDTAVRSLKELKNIQNRDLASKSYYNLGNIMREAGDMEESLEYYKKAITLDPTDKDAKINFELLKQNTPPNAYKRGGSVALL